MRMVSWSMYTTILVYWYSDRVFVCSIAFCALIVASMCYYVSKILMLPAYCSPASVWSFLHPFVCLPCKLQSVFVSILDNFICINMGNWSHLPPSTRNGWRSLAVRFHRFSHSDCRLHSTAQRQTRFHRCRRQYLQSMTGCRPIHCLFSIFSHFRTNKWNVHRQLDNMFFHSPYFSLRITWCNRYISNDSNKAIRKRRKNDNDDNERYHVVCVCVWLSLRCLRPCHCLINFLLITFA